MSGTTATAAPSSWASLPGMETRQTSTGSTRGPVRGMQRRLVPGDEGTVWLTAGLGHRFVVVEEASGETLGKYEATDDAIHSIVAAPRPIKAQRRAASARRTTSESSNRTARTASKGRGPNAVMIGRPYLLLFLRISRRTGTTTPRPVWSTRSGVPTARRQRRDGVKVDNPSHVHTQVAAPPEMCYLRFGSKGGGTTTRWRRWSNSGSETSSSRTRTSRPPALHAREHADAARRPRGDARRLVIVNIGQYGMDEAWPLQIYDLHSGEMTNVTMEPGELLASAANVCTGEVPLNGGLRLIIRPLPAAGRSQVVPRGQD